MVDIHAALSTLISNKRRVGALKKLGVITCEDLLTYYPFRVSAPVAARSMDQIAVGQPAVCGGVIDRVHVSSMARGGSRIVVEVRDSEPGARASVQLVYFTHKKYYVDYLLSRLREGQRIAVQGTPSAYGGTLQFTHPVTCTVRDDDASFPLGQADSLAQALDKLSQPQPVYHATSRISSPHIHETVLTVLEALTGISHVSTQPDEDESAANARNLQAHAEDLAAVIPDVLPESVRVEYKLMHKAEALLAVHCPTTPEEFDQGLDSLRWEEAFVSQMAMVMAREDTKSSQAYVCEDNEGYVQRLVNSLPFVLTEGQQEVIAEISVDMRSGTPMSRLLQGEVGSGKTLVALAAVLKAVGAGHQAVLVAPTQVLAQQHFASIGRALADAGLQDIPLVLLQSGMKLAERRRALSVPASGVPCIVVATHAAFSKTFQAPHLALVVIDEQHRFGVEQREVLRSEVNEEGMVPHMLVMTATPIPRSAAMTWFGNLDMSWLAQLPGGRKPIRTILVNEADTNTMKHVFIHARERIDAGERVYVVCKRIDVDGEDAEDAYNESGFEEIGIDPLTGELVDKPARVLHSVEEMSERLASLPQFTGISVVTLTGRDDDATKAEVMERFSSGEAPLVVSTTVIEVGVDVPQASCIIIFDADTFGLSQLHQLRGRVGRGGTQSWAFFVHNAEPESIASERLAVIRDSSDGAVIAQKDLELRGAGDVLKSAQAGFTSSFKLLHVVKNADIIIQARQAAQDVFEHDKNLSRDAQLKGAVLDFMRMASGYSMNS
ncbi:ATP-dependent DNA helicase RecG [Alloscardovia omnicolens]|uniref:ATP-dependent DNA helicase RecG n=1 Tax=Alloscardovia omnicolens TaxID=419015 RepID=UPI003C703398